MSPQTHPISMKSGTQVPKLKVLKVSLNYVSYCTVQASCRINNMHKYASICNGERERQNLVCFIVENGEYNGVGLKDISKVFVMQGEFFLWNKSF